MVIFWSKMVKNCADLGQFLGFGTRGIWPGAGVKLGPNQVESDQFDLIGFNDL